MGSGCGQIVGGSGQRGRGPQQPPERVAKDLRVHAVTLVLTGELRCEWSSSPRPGSGRGQPGHRSPCVCSDRPSQRRCGTRRRAGRTCRRTGGGPNQQSLAVGRQSAPACRDLSPPRRELPAQVSRSAAGQINRRRVDKHAQLLADTGDLGRGRCCEVQQAGMSPSDYEWLPQRRNAYRTCREAAGVIELLRFSHRPGDGS